MAEETKTEAAEATGMAALGALTEMLPLQQSPRRLPPGRAEDRQSWPLLRNRPPQGRRGTRLGQAGHRPDEDQWP